MSYQFKSYKDLDFDNIPFSFKEVKGPWKYCNCDLIVKDGEYAILDEFNQHAYILPEWFTIFAELCENWGREAVVNDFREILMIKKRKRKGQQR